MTMAKKYCPNFEGSTWYRSCKEEIIDPIHGKISGTIPNWLKGALIRNGPGLFQFGDSTMSHLFDGMALLHRFEVKDGIVTYQCRFIQTDVYKKTKAANRIVMTDFGTTSVPDPCETIFHRISSAFSRQQDVPDNAAISVYPFGDEMYAFAESAFMYKVDKDNLETQDKMNCRRKFAIITHTAHPHVTEDGTVFNLALSTSKKPVYHIVKFPNKPKSDEDDYSMFDKAHICATIPSRWKFNPSYMHSFGISENYFVIIEQPACFSASKVLLSKFLNMTALDLFQWYNDTTKFIVVSRKTGDVVETFYSKGFFYFHTINQYEDSDHIVLDICTFKDFSVLYSLYIEEMKNANNNPNYGNTFHSVPHRFVLPLGKKASTENLVKLPYTTAKAYLANNGDVTVEPELICEVTCELPTIHYDQLSGKKYQFFYAFSFCATSINPGALIKVDVLNKTSLTWYEEGSYPSEPIFVPAPDAQKEDDGVVLASLIDRKDENCVSLLILEASTFTEIGRVEFRTPSPVPRTFHGWYFPDNLSQSTCKL